MVESGELDSNPMFALIEQPGIGTCRAAGLPAVFDGRHLFAGAAPTLGADGADVLSDVLGYTRDDIDAGVADGHLGKATREP
ncbi:hypothetical protein [Nocardia sp. NBC_01377]|uniref:hypothetical protein n=1 Tax=Nocardia sp. NBC_01377 TaxID=2903595 RepID=UPI0038667C56